MYGLRGIERAREARQRLRRGAAIAIALGALSIAGGCTSLRQWWRNGFKVGPNAVTPCAPVSAGWVDAGDPRISGWPAEGCYWWTTFNDASLNSLVDAAYRQNLDLRTAGARILEARAQRNVAAGNLFPQRQTALAAYAHGQLPQNLGLPLPGTFNVWTDGFNASWEIDFWGRYRRAVEAADGDLGASVERYGETLVMLLSEVATSYVQMRTYEQRLEYARRNVIIQRGTTKIAEDRYRSGRSSEVDVRQARSILAQTEASIPPLEAGRRQAANQLCILLGTPVNDLAAQLPPAAIPRAPIELAVGIPADLLRRRPDVRRAAREAGAQGARIGVAEADMYPRLAINGFIGYAANDLSDLFNSKSFVGFIIPTLQWNVLNYGRILNNVRAADARYQQSLLQYQQTVLTAGREVEDALVGFLQSQQQAARLQDAVTEAERFVELVDLQYQAGVVDFNRVFNAQSTLVTVQDQLATARGNIALNLIQTYRALGGGWECFACGPNSQQPMPVAPVVPPLAPPVVPAEVVVPVQPPPSAASNNG
ncbi:MAG TPA: efflux transporter outer membrane subunit [Pirellulales bacterium]|nr:efflux transporter outer membrane subunit [Pirellulales bacterium]